MGNSEQEIKFREDIELLRGIAILLVFTYHLKIAFVKSGFIGVDIFFVISGFLIAAALKGTSKSEIISFYDRRARRVLPACFIIFFIFFAASPLLFLPFETKKITESFIGTLAGAPNFVFWLENSYFDELSFRPMLHYWSLGVEIQYYILFPFLIYFTRGRLSLIFLVFIISFIGCIVLAKVSAKSAFFLTPARVWEFLAGFFAYRLSDQGFLKNMKGKNFLSVAALVTMCVVATRSIPQTNYPSYYAAIPVSLAFIFLLLGLDIKGSVARTVALPIRFLGKISYSFYLIHYPIIFLFLYSPFSEWKTIKLYDLALISIITLLLSIASYHFIEERFRNRKKYSSRKMLTLFAGFLTVSITSIFIFQKSDYFSGFFPKAEQDAFYAVNDYGDWRCSTAQQLSSLGELSCTLHSKIENNRTILLIGDSHMDAIKHLFLDAPDADRVNVRLFKESCLLGTAHCTAKSILEEVDRYSITDLVLHGAFSDKFDYAELEKLSTQAKPHGLKIHFFTPIPTYPLSVPKIVYEHERGITPLETFIYTRESFVISRHLKYQDFSSRTGMLENVFFYDTSTVMCSEYCLVRDDEGVYYHDSHHLSFIGSKRLYPLVNQVLSNHPN